MFCKEVLMSQLRNIQKIIYLFNFKVSQLQLLHLRKIKNPYLYQQPKMQVKCCFCGNCCHPRLKCPARDAVCNKCGRQGHFSKVCKSPKSVNNSTGTSGINNLSTYIRFTNTRACWA